MGNIGASELLLILAIAVLVFGAGRIPEILRGLGTGIRLFKKGLSEDEDSTAHTPSALSSSPAPKAQLDPPRASDAHSPAPSPSDAQPGERDDRRTSQ